VGKVGDGVGEEVVKEVKVSFNGFIKRVKYWEEDIRFMGKVVEAVVLSEKIPMAEAQRLAQMFKKPIKNKDVVVLPPLNR
jgi:hypothetical protein